MCKKDQELIIRRLIHLSARTNDIKRIKKYIVTKLGKKFDADRCVIRGFDAKNSCFLPIQEYEEYRKSDEIKSFSNFCFMPDASKLILDILKKKEILIIDDYEKYLEEIHLEEGPLKDLVEDFPAKSGISHLLMSFQKEIIGLFAMHYINRPLPITKQDIAFIKTVVYQASIAIYQTKLYEKEKNTAKRESIVRHVIEATRSSLDLNKVLSTICIEITKGFNAGRVSIIQFNDPEDYTNWKVKSEIKKKKYYKAIKDVYFDPKIGEFWGEKLFHNSNLYRIENIPDSDLPDILKETYKIMGLKSLVGMPIQKGKHKWGGLFISEYEYFRHWNEEEINLLETLSSQIYTAINQATLYERQKQTAEKESLLRGIIQTIMSTLDTDIIKQKIVDLTGKAMGADRCIIVDFDFERRLFKPIEYEYLNTSEKSSIVGFNPEKEIPELSNIIRKGEELLAYDFEEYFKERGLENCISVKSHRKNKVKSDIAIPIIFMDKLYGTFVLHYTRKKRILNNEELDFIRTITNQTAIALHQLELYENIKQTAQKETILRNIFILTLAHDFHVPVIGEQKALEFINSKDENLPIKVIKPIINSITENNQLLNTSLVKLIDIYNYELNNKQLELKEYNLDYIIDCVIKSYKFLATSKEIEIRVNIEKSLKLVYVDFIEIQKALGYIVQNAIEYSPEKSLIEISACEADQENVVICIKDNGPGISEEFIYKIFKRYEMIKLLKRKIGAGLSLYLANLIVIAHNGKISITSKINNGSVFCVYLPANIKK